MIIPNQLIEVAWSSSNRKHYEKLGYVYTKAKDIFYVPPEHLSKGSHSKFLVQCDRCQVIKKVSAHDYFRWNRTALGDYLCQDCYQATNQLKSLQRRQDKIYNQVMSVAGEFGYDILTKKEDITTIDSMIQYRCPHHGVQERRAHLFIYGTHACPECNKESKMLSIEEVKANIECRGGKLHNPEDYQGSQKKNLKISCRRCGDLFITSYNSYIYTRDQKGQLCPKCSQFLSMGEVAVEKYLKSRHIMFEFQKHFSDCKDKHTLPFDFFLPQYRIAIEYDGEQHFSPVAFSKSGPFSSDELFLLRQKHDKIKDIYCQQHSIKLIRIPYTEYNSIENILDKELFNSHEDIV